MPSKHQHILVALLQKGTVTFVGGPQELPVLHTIAVAICVDDLDVVAGLLTKIDFFQHFNSEYKIFLAILSLAFTFSSYPPTFPTVASTMYFRQSIPAVFISFQTWDRLLLIGGLKRPLSSGTPEESSSGWLCCSGGCGSGGPSSWRLKREVVFCVVSLSKLTSPMIQGISVWRKPVLILYPRFLISGQDHDVQVLLSRP